MICCPLNRHINAKGQKIHFPLFNDMNNNNEFVCIMPICGCKTTNFLANEVLLNATLALFEYMSGWHNSCKCDINLNNSKMY